ncbi:MAG: 30S ribosome-binding factor RbfA [Betaproteobacteria bacterium]|nr:30S ribosome-binding factor RbfA [Betaproteobacteria bacterium]MDE2212526.1 30S ribosome-binding factor RbfA [Betaproteobacteria bacterium]
MAAFPRSRRIGDQIQKDLSDLIRRELKDPRVGMVTITAVEVSADYSHAKVYVASLQGPESLKRSLEALRESAGFLRRLLGRRLTTRTQPQLHFLEDQTLDRAMAITSLIDEAVASDAKHPKS